MADDIYVFYDREIQPYRDVNEVTPSNEQIIELARRKLVPLQIQRTEYLDQEKRVTDCTVYFMTEVKLAEADLALAVETNVVDIAPGHVHGSQQCPECFFQYMEGVKSAQEDALQDREKITPSESKHDDTAYDTVRKAVYASFKASFLGFSDFAVDEMARDIVANLGLDKAAPDALQPIDAENLYTLLLEHGVTPYGAGRISSTVVAKRYGVPKLKPITLEQAAKMRLLYLENTLGTADEDFQSAVNEVLGLA
jgi:hypothetical protein